MVKKSARRTRRTHSPTFKAQVALAALRDNKTMAELCKEFALHASQVIEWKRQLLEGAAGVFGAGSHAAPPVDLARRCPTGSCNRRRCGTRYAANFGSST